MARDSSHCGGGRADGAVQQSRRGIARGRRVLHRSVRAQRLAHRVARVRLWRLVSTRAPAPVFLRGVAAPRRLGGAGASPHRRAEQRFGFAGGVRDRAARIQPGRRTHRGHGSARFALGDRDRALRAHVHAVSGDHGVVRPLFPPLHRGPQRQRIRTDGAAELRGHLDLGRRSAARGRESRSLAPYPRTDQVLDGVCR